MPGSVLKTMDLDILFFPNNGWRQTYVLKILAFTDIMYFWLLFL